MHKRTTVVAAGAGAERTGIETMKPDSALPAGAIVGGLAGLVL